MNNNLKEKIPSDKRLEMIIIEIQQLQGWFDKYDGLIFKSRGWLVTVFVAILGFVIDKSTPKLTYLLIGVAGFFYFFELFWLYRYCLPRTMRFLFIKEYLNNNFEKIDNIKLFDINDYSKKNRLSNLPGKLLEPTLFYCGLIIGIFIVHSLLIVK